MIKTLNNVMKMDREKFKVPRSVQDVIPIQTIWADGIFQVGKTKFSKTFQFTDINYAVADPADQETMFKGYATLINTLEAGATTKITINNRRLNRANFEQNILLPMAHDGLDHYREEYNQMMLDKAMGSSSIVQDKYITVSVYKRNIEEARSSFKRIGAELAAHFSRLSSKCYPLEAVERLRIFYDFFRAGEEAEFAYNLKQSMRKGHSFKDYICPDTFEFESDYFRMGDRYGRVIFLRDYATFIKDTLVTKLCDLNRSMMLSIDIIPVPTDEAVREVENRLLGVETNVTNWQRRQNQNNNFSATVPYDMEQQRGELREFMDDLTTRDQRMTFGVMTIVHTADTKEQLDSDTEALRSIASAGVCQLATLKYQQMDGLNTALPYGVRRIDALRTLTTDSLAAFMPFHVQEIYHSNGMYYGQNAISKNMIIADRRRLLNGNSFILGVSGSGKSFTAKQEMIGVILSDPNADIIVIDPERECSLLINEMRGEVIHISAASESHINAMDISLALQGYNFGNGYISWAISHYGGYSATNAQEFSNMQARAHGWISYGDPAYVPHVLRYYPFGRVSTGGNQAIVEIALSQIGNVGGQPYWSWYGFNSHVQWCACFVSWCADQCGYIDSEIIPKHAACQDGANWFQAHGQWKSRDYIPSPGDIIYFDWNGDGHTEHVGIVEKVENGTVYTVEGNASNTCARRNYMVESSDIYGYGIPAY